MRVSGSKLSLPRLKLSHTNRREKKEKKMQRQIPLQIISKKLIKPSTPTPQILGSLKISSVDQVIPPIYVSFIYCYPAKNQNDESAERLSKQLEKSLSEILTLFYPLAGRYIEENLSIDCNDHGVEYLEAKVASQLVTFLDRYVDSKQLIDLIPYRTETATSPLLAVQCNMFECGGLVLGLCISHRIVDAAVYSKFLDGWAKATRDGIHGVHIRPIFDLASILPTIDINVLPCPQDYRLKPGLKTASRTFVFTHLAISDLRKMANNKGSRLQLVTAVIWKALMWVAETKHGKLRPSLITHMLNLRGRTLLPISDDCCGNLIRPVIVRFFPEENYRNLQFQDFVPLIGDAISKTINDCVKIEKGDDLFLMVNNAWREACEEFERGGVDAYSFTSSCGMPFYPNFGWGKPVQVTHVQSQVEMIVLIDTRDGDGIEAMICLDENDMQLFQQDPDIITFTSIQKKAL